MIEERPDQPTVFDPASMSTSTLGNAKAVWYKRPWVIITVVVVLVVAISVITDLPHPIARSQDVAAQNSSIKSVNSDIQPCVFAVGEAFRFYRQDVTTQVTSSQLATIKTYLNQDATSCSFASAGMSDLTNNLQVLDTAAGKYIDKMLGVTVIWLDGYALSAIDDIVYLVNHPGNATKIADLANQERKLATQRQLALDDLSTASRILGTALTNLNLPVMPQLPGT
jgi:hypothetical protein